MATRMQQRRGNAAQWTSADPILAAGEIGFETDTGKFKIGNGSSAWSALTYFADVTALVDGAPELLDTLNELAAAIGDDAQFFTTVATLDGVQTLTNKTLQAADLGSDSTAVTQVGADNSTKIATTEFVQGRLNAFIDSAPGALDTLNELAAALGDDPNFATTVTTGLAEKVAKAGDTMTGFLTLSGSPEQDSHAATKAYVDGEIGTHDGTTQNIHGIVDTSLLATQAYADSAADGAVSTHNSDTTNVHGIVDTSVLATQSYVDAAEVHNAVTTNVHGIVDTSLLATQAYADSAEVHSAVTTNVHGIVDTADLLVTADLTGHNDDTTGVHGIADTSALVLTDDARLSDTRTPTDDTVSTEKIVNSAVTADKLAGDAVTEAKIADGAVTSGKIADGAIVNADINAAAAIDWTKLGISSTVSSTELGYVAGVTSAIQTQIDAVPGLIATAKSEAIADATAQVTAVIDSAPAALDTLNELAAALGDDANFASTVTTSLDGKVASYTPISEKTASYTLSSLTERDTMIEFNASSGVTVTIPTNSTVAYPVGTSLDILQTGSGQVTVAGAGGVTVNGTPGLKLRAQWSSATLFKRAENTWVVVGDLSA